jgi:hypothetical protein
METEPLHFRKGKLSVLAIVLLVVIGFIFLVILAAGYWVGLAGVIPFVAMFGIREGVYVDLKKGMYRSYLNVLGMGSSVWKPIPEDTRIGIRALKLVSNRTMGLRTLDSRETQVTLELYLYMPGPQRVVLETSDNFKALHKKAELMHAFLGYEIVIDPRIERMMNE